MEFLPVEELVIMEIVQELLLLLLPVPATSDAAQLVTARIPPFLTLQLSNVNIVVIQPL
jgi:hypothetical protein